MSAGQNTEMMKGAVAACILPMSLGALGCFYLVGSGPFPTFGFMLWPIAQCFLLGTPVAAWLACRRLKKVGDPKILSLWRKSASSGIFAASLVHFIAAGGYTLYVIFSAADRHNGAGITTEFSGFLLVSLIINIGLFTILTLPFALICATIFWAVTKFEQVGTSPDLWK